MAFRSFAHWTSPEPSGARRVVVRLRCIGPLDPSDVAEIRAMKHLRELVLEGVEALPEALCDLPELRALTINKRGEAGVARLPDAVRGLVSLRTLRLRARRATALPDALLGLVELVELDLRHSGVRRLPERILELPKLRRIALGCRTEPL